MAWVGLFKLLRSDSLLVYLVFLQFLRGTILIEIGDCRVNQISLLHKGKLYLPFDNLNKLFLMVV